MKYKSLAEWPLELALPNNKSDDMLESRAAAEAVCTMLRGKGFGGDGKVFPVRTWVEPMSEAWPLSEIRQRLLLVNAHQKLRRQYKKVPLWSFVSEMTGHGSGYSTEICIVNGWNPDQDGSVPIGWGRSRCAGDTSADSASAPSLPNGGRTSS